MAKIKETIKLPLITMKGLVVFPGMVLNFDVTKPKFVEAIKTACFSDKQIFLVTQKSYDKEDPKKEDLYITGVVAEIKQVLKTPDKITTLTKEPLKCLSVTTLPWFRKFRTSLSL